jgi:hypothetical protein
VIMGPPFVLSDDEATMLVDRTVAAVRTVA